MRTQSTFTQTYRMEVNVRFGELLLYLNEGNF